MNIVGARIDGRLVHGQVANLWTPKLQADRIIVVDEEAAKSDIQKKWFENGYTSYDSS